LLKQDWVLLRLAIIRVDPLSSSVNMKCEKKNLEMCKIGIRNCTMLCPIRMLSLLDYDDVGDDGCKHLLEKINDQKFSQQILHYCVSWLAD
jgi:hypothetical protein